MLSSVKSLFASAYNNITWSPDENWQQEKELKPINEVTVKTEEPALETVDNPSNIASTLSAALSMGSNIYYVAARCADDVSSLVSKTATNFDYKSIIQKAPLLRDFTQTQETFVRELSEGESANSLLHIEPVCENNMHIAVLPPWHPDVSGVSDADSVTKFRTLVFVLSLDARNFLRSPPSSSSPEFRDWETKVAHYMPTARLLLQEDANLASMRFRLVPARISENNFWRNYFYRISIIRQSIQLNALSKSDDDAIHIKSDDLMPEEDVESESQDLENLDTGSIDDNGSLDHISSEDMDEACRAAPTPGVINRAADAARIPLARLSDHSN